VALGTDSEDGVFNTGRFDQATFNNVARSEVFSPSVDESVFTFKTFLETASAFDNDTEFSLFTEVFQPASASDSEVLTVFRSVVQPAAVSDTRFNKVLRGVSEAVGAVDVQSSTTGLVLPFESVGTSTVLNFGTLLGPVPQDGVFNTGRFGEARFSSVVRGETPDSSAQASTLFVEGIPLSVNVFVADSDVFNVGISLFERQDFGDAERKRLERPLGELVDVPDVVRKDLRRVRTASFAALDQESFTASKPVFEGVPVTDVFAKRDFKQFSEVVSVSDSVRRLHRAFRALGEQVRPADVAVTRLEKALGQDVLASDSSETRTLKPLTQTVTPGDSEFAEMQKPLDESLGSEDDARKRLDKPLAAGVVAADTSTNRFFKDLVQPVVTSDSDIKEVSQPLLEAISFVDTSRQRSQRIFEESVPIADFKEKAVFRTLLQVVGSVDLSRFTFRTSFKESASPVDVSRFRLSRPLLQEEVGLVDEVFNAKVVLLGESFDVLDLRSVFKPANFVADLAELRGLRVAVAELRKTRRAVADLEAKEAAKTSKVR